MLYLDVASGVAAPTVLWDDESPRHRSLYVVPALPARLLRFDGTWVHAVPKPAGEHLGELQAEAEEEAEAAAGGVLRHVLLFNSWPDAPPEGLEGSHDDDVPRGERPRGERALSSSGGGTSAVARPLSARPFGTWSVTPIMAKGAMQGAKGAQAAADSDGALAADASDGTRLVRPSSTAYTARLMGGPRRRGRSERYRCDALAAPKEAVHHALYDPELPSSFRVR